MRNDEIVYLTVSHLNYSIWVRFDHLKLVLLRNGFHILWKSGLNYLLLIKRFGWMSTHSLQFLMYPHDPWDRVAGSSRARCLIHHSHSEHFLTGVEGPCRDWPWQGSIRTLN